MGEKVMIKKNLKTIIITSLIMLLPVLAGIVLWDKLPDTLPTHWNFSGEVDGTSGKAFGVFGMPLIMLAFHILCAIVTSMDPKTQDFNGKMMGIVFWICPILSILCMTAVYAEALGNDVNIELIAPLFMGMLFFVIGNYLPKCKQNYTIGIKIPWTLNDTDNWNKTHRFAGRVWLVCSVVVMSGAFFKSVVVFTTFVPILVMVFAPMIYSYMYYRKHR
jgi:uncharacterized membrane protein